MPVELSFSEMAGFGALVAFLAVLLLGALIVLVMGGWVSRRAARFRSFGIERTEQGSVQFKGLVDSKEQARAAESVAEASVMERWLGESKFPPREEESKDPVN